MRIGVYLGLLSGGEGQLAGALETVAARHGDEPDIAATCNLLAGWSRERGRALAPYIDRYDQAPDDEPLRLRVDLFHGPPSGGLGLLRDLHDLNLLASEVRLCWTILHQAARALDDQPLVALCEQGGHGADRQLAWLCTRIKAAAPQALVVT